MAQVLQRLLEVNLNLIEGLNGLLPVQNELMMSGGGVRGDHTWEDEQGRAGLSQRLP